MVEIYDDSYQKVLTAAEVAFEEAKEARATDVEDKLEAMLAAREQLNACTLRNTDLTQKTSHGEDSLRGTVLTHLAKPATHVEAGEPVLLVRPKDTFYAFNKTLAIFSFIGVVVALFFHRLASR
ncbi:MAG: hypothetical protein JEZ10_02130 [Verrucomicrobia bacterium]|nr:hypothetical protein [Verrucomicrobiota bacterium]